MMGGVQMMDLKEATLTSKEFTNFWVSNNPNVAAKLPKLLISEGKGKDKPLISRRKEEGYVRARKAGSPVSELPLEERDHVSDQRITIVDGDYVDPDEYATRSQTLSLAQLTLAMEDFLEEVVPGVLEDGVVDRKEFFAFVEKAKNIQPKLFGSRSPDVAAAKKMAHSTPEEQEESSEEIKPYNSFPVVNGVETFMPQASSFVTSEQSVFEKRIDGVVPANWCWFYCGGSKVVQKRLEADSKRWGINLQVERFDW